MIVFDIKKLFAKKRIKKYAFWGILLIIERARDRPRAAASISALSNKYRHRDVTDEQMPVNAIHMN